MATGVHIHVNYGGNLLEGQFDLLRRSPTEGRHILSVLAAFLDRVSAGMEESCTVQVSLAPTAPVNASGTITISTGAPTAGDTVTIGGTALTAVADNTASPTTAQWRIGTSTATAATNICQAINNNATIRSKVYATVAGSVVTVTAKDPGQAGNAITLAKSGTNIAVSGAALTSGAGNDGAPYWAANGASMVSSQPSSVPFNPTNGGGLVTFTVG